MTRPGASPAGKTALVTSAATGIGQAIAAALPAAGPRVVVNHNHTLGAADKTVARIKAADGVFHGVQLALQHLADHCADAAGRRGLRRHQGPRSSNSPASCPGTSGSGGSR